MKKLETGPLYLKIMMKKLPLDLMFNSDQIGLHWKWMSSGPVPRGKHRELRSGEGSGRRVTQAPGAAATCGLPVSVFLFGSLQFIFIPCAHSSIGVEWLAPDPIFLHSSCIFSAVNCFGFWFKSTHVVPKQKHLSFQQPFSVLPWTRSFSSTKYSPTFTIMPDIFSFPTWYEKF